MPGKTFPIISTGDLPAAQAFYERLGFVETYRFPEDGEPGFVTVERGGSSIGLGAGAPERAGSAVAIWVYVDDVDATVSELRDAGAPVVEEPADQPWGERIARVVDPAGIEVVLGQPLV